jgi:hypothetical protein
MNTYRVNNDYIMIVGEGRKENADIYCCLFDLSIGKKPTLNTLDYLNLIPSFEIINFDEIKNNDFDGRLCWIIQSGICFIADTHKYIEILKNEDLKEIKPFKVVKTYSDVGSVKIGNDSFQFNISNGYGDGDTDVLISDAPTEAPKNAEYVMHIDGDFNIYSYDCSTSDVAHTLHGAYYVYSQRDLRADHGKVWFIKEC